MAKNTADALKQLIMQTNHTAFHRPPLNTPLTPVIDQSNWFTSASLGSVDALQSLSLKEIDIDQADKTGLTALHYAAREGHSEAVQFLIDKGADLNITTPDGNRPVDLARSHPATAALLTRAEKERSLQIDSQFDFLKNKRKDTPPPLSISDDDCVYASARVTDLERWKNYVGVFHDSEVLIESLKGKRWSVMGRVKIDRFEALSVQPFIAGLSVVTPTLLD